MSFQRVDAGDVTTACAVHFSGGLREDDERDCCCFLDQDCSSTNTSTQGDNVLQDALLLMVKLAICGRLNNTLPALSFTKDTRYEMDFT